MARYTVHVPTFEASQQNPLERAVFVREGWSWGAFIFGPLWLLWHRHIAFGLVVLVLYGLLLAAINAMPVHANAAGIAHVLLSLLFGLEGASLRRFALGTAAHAEVALVTGDTQDEIERRFFAGQGSGLQGAVFQGASPAASPRLAAHGGNPADTGVIGLFPKTRLM